jgi:hypothetical protein
MSASFHQIEMDFSNAFCPLDCCRIVPMSFDFLDRIKPHTTRLLGLNDEEVDKVKTLREASLQVDGQCEVAQCNYKLNPTDDPWAKWNVE